MGFGWPELIFMNTKVYMLSGDALTSRSNLKRVVKMKNESFNY